MNKQNNDLAHSFAVRLMQYLVVPTFVLDAERRVIIWNKACERLTGLSAEAVVGTCNHWQAFYHEERYCLADVLALDRSDEMASLYSAHTEPSETGNGLRAENWCNMPHTGKRLYLAIDAGPIFDEQGRLVAVVETLRDMTETKEAQLALQHLAARDGLTGIANRRAFDQKLTQEWLRAQRDRTPLSLILIDVDHFKRYNDGYGHQQGDECLRQVAAAIDTALLRPADLAARYGGEEFAVIVPGTDASGVATIAERICDAIRALKLPHAHSETAPVVTVSAGTATATPLPGADMAPLLTEADQALYAAKRAGRNQVSRAPACTA